MDTGDVRALARSLHAQVVETHISWVLLGPDFAWKIKKPVRWPFVDYSTLERRRHCCEEEVRLNARLAPALYVGVQPIPAQGTPVEYAVHMRRFAAGALFSEQLAAGTLRPEDVDAFAATLADFHQRAPAQQSGTSPHPQRALAALDGAAALFDGATWERIRTWLHDRGQALQPLWDERRARGCVRECHGDLHLDNVVRLQDGPAAFDCIEFDPALRWIDVIEDAAFCFMDFLARGRADLGWRFLNAWLDATGEHDALPALPFVVVYRALVRAQVEQLRNPHSPAAQRYAACAAAWSTPREPRLSITHGLPGSGKSFVSQRLVEAEGAVRLRSDVERKRLFGLAMLEDSRSRGVHLYTESATRRTYDVLLHKAALALGAGLDVLVDAAFLLRAERRRALHLAQSLGAGFRIVPCEAPLPVLRRRLRERRGDPSEADVGVLEQLRPLLEPLTPAEHRFVRE